MPVSDELKTALIKRADGGFLDKAKEVALKAGKAGFNAVPGGAVTNAVLWAKDKVKEAKQAADRIKSGTATKDDFDNVAVKYGSKILGKGEEYEVAKNNQAGIRFANKLRENPFNVLAGTDEEFNQIFGLKDRILDPSDSIFGSRLTDDQRRAFKYAMPFIQGTYALKTLLRAIGNTFGQLGTANQQTQTRNQTNSGNASVPAPGASPTTNSGAPKTQQQSFQPNPTIKNNYNRVNPADKRYQTTLKGTPNNN